MAEYLNKQKSPVKIKQRTANTNSNIQNNHPTILNGMEIHNNASENILNKISPNNVLHFNYISL